MASHAHGKTERRRKRSGQCQLLFTLNLTVSREPVPTLTAHEIISAGATSSKRAAADWRLSFLARTCFGRGDWRLVWQH